MGTRLDKKSSQVRKRIENHAFTDEGGEEYEPSTFGGFGDYFRRKKIKLQNLDSELRTTSDKPPIFKGIVAYILGYTQPTREVLHRDLVQHGAGYLQYLDGKTMATHIIASALPPKKAVDFNKYRMVKPQWVVDSVKAGKMLPWQNYRVVDELPSQKTIRFDGGKMMSQATTPQRLGYREQTQDSAYNELFKSSELGTQSASQIQSPGFNSQLLSNFAEKTDSEKEKSQPEDVKMNDMVEDDEADLLADVDDEDLAALADITPAIKFEPAPENATLDPTRQSPDAENGVETDSDMFKNMTSEEHNAWLLSDPKIRKSSSANPNFLQQFYSESRLHHLSTWKAELKSKMQRLANERGPSIKPSPRKPGSRRYIMHVDFDSFFCAVSLKKHPEYVDKPAVVAHGTGTGSEIASCNYPAREFGVKNGMWMKKALELCPDLKVLPYDFPAYEEASRLFYEAILDVGGVVQSVSVDEALVDITSLVLSATGSHGYGVDEGSIWREQEKVDALALDLRTRVKEKTGCSVSVGIGGNVLLAKVALRKAKPAGQHQIKPEQVLDALADLEAKDLPGVAYSISGKLEDNGIKLVRDIRQASKERLVSLLGPKTGEKLWDYARGVDKTEIGEQPPRKSVSAEVSWGIRFINQQEAEDFVMNLCKELERRLLNEQVRGKHLTMKIMRRSLDAPLDPFKHLGHGKCDVFNKSAAFGISTHSAEMIGREAVSILRSFKFSPGDLRGLGVQLTKLEPIKASLPGLEGSQKRLSFSPFGGPPSKKPRVESIEEMRGFDTPTPARTKTDPIEETQSPIRQNDKQPRTAEDDPIADDPLTPRKPKAHPALGLSRASEKDKKATTPLNIGGTQFIIPTQIDPTVLAELGPDIQQTILDQRKGQLNLREMAKQKPKNSRPAPAYDVPLASQIDREVFEALPEELRAEVIAAYGRQPAPVPAPAPAAAPRRQSPRRAAVLQLSKATTPTKKRGASKTGKGKAEVVKAKTLQPNFLLKKAPSPDPIDVPDELDEDFLAELPDDVRHEVMEDHRRRLAFKKARLRFEAPFRRAQKRWLNWANGPRRVHFPTAPEKVTFSAGLLSSAKELRDMLEEWHDDTWDEGPHEEDVVVLEKYLGKVVLEERDMDKAAKLVQWLDWLVEADEREGEGKEFWREAVVKLKEAVQGFVKERGLGVIKF